MERCVISVEDTPELLDGVTDGEKANCWGGLPDLAFLWSCPTCCYWQWADFFENRGVHGGAAVSVLARFDARVPEGCWAELAQHLRRNSALWHNLDPRGMERLVAAIFRANHSHSDVMHVGKSGDLGIDVVFVEAKGDKWLIQVKRREKTDAVEGFETLQKLLGTLALEGEFRGVIASNAHHFSFQAKHQAKRASLRGYTLELLDRGKLHRMLGPLLPDRPWRQYLRERGFPEEILKRFLSETSSLRQGTLFD